MENLEFEEAELLKRLEEIRKKKEELSKPIKVEVTNVIFGGIGAIVEFKCSRVDDKVLNVLRYKVPTRNFIASRQVNQIDIKYYDKLLYELNEIDIKLEVSEEFQNQIKKWKESPDFILTVDAKKNQIKISRTIRRTVLPYIYEMSTYTHIASGDYSVFSINELPKWMEFQLNHPQWKFELSDEVTKLYEQQAEREKLLNQFADMKDAPDIDFKFQYQKDSEEIIYELKPDQRVACKFDDTFNHRTLLSFDMGKGKTAIAIAQAERNNERVLFVCKADLKTNIKREIKKFTNKEAIIFSGIEPDGLAVDLLLLNKKQYNIINYDIIGRELKDKDDPSKSIMKWVEIINLSNFDRIIYDEAHYMANIETQRSRGGRSLKAPKVMLLTGTPIVNRPGEIYPILNIIDSVTFSDYATFKNQFTRLDGMPKNLPELHKLLKRYMIRRKADSSNKPNRIVQYTELSQQARINYSKVMEGIYISLRNPEYKRDINNILVELMRCKQICADDKVDFTVDLTETALDETSEMPWNKVLIYSQFKATQAEICSRLGSKAKVINGEVTDKARYELVDQFMDMTSELKVIITNITEGLTLTSAFTTIINDLPWTPKSTAQFEGRAFGRENDPHGGNSYYPLVEDTTDDMIWGLLEKKQLIAEQIVDDVYSKVEVENSVISDLINMLKGR